MNEKVIGLIPARMGSSRFPGKPIVKICGKPMICWVYEQAKKARGINEIYVVTPDTAIEDVCNEFNIPCLLEHHKAITAAESMSYIVRDLDGDIYLNIQGDEPLIEPEAIEQVIQYMLNDKEVYYLGLRSHITTEEEFRDRNVVKAVVDAKEYAMYFSRSPIPSNFNPDTSFRVMGMYGYRASFLKKFADIPLGILQAKESGVEMLRAMEAGYKIKLIKTKFSTIGVDLPEHIPLIEQILSKNNRT